MLQKDVNLVRTEALRSPETASTEKNTGNALCCVALCTTLRLLLGGRLKEADQCGTLGAHEVEGKEVRHQVVREGLEVENVGKRQDLAGLPRAPGAAEGHEKPPLQSPQIRNQGNFQ